MATNYDFANSSNWSLLWNQSFEAVAVSNSILNRYYPIADFTMPFLISSSVVAIHIESDTNPGSWRKGGYCKQKIQTGALSGSNFDSYLNQKYLQLDKINIFQLQNVSGEFSLEFAVPYWLRQVTVTVWEYTGAIGDTIDEKLNNLQTYIADCCEELTSLANTQNTELSNQIQITIDKLSSSEVILNSISSAVGGDGEPGNATLESIDDRLDVFQSILTSISTSVVTDIENINSVVSLYSNQINQNIDNLSNNLSNVLNGENADILNVENNQISLEEEFL